MGRDKRTYGKQDLKSLNVTREIPTYQCLNGIVLTVRDENLVRVDLHGKKTTDVRDYILKGISDAHIKCANVVEVIHGFNRGSTLKKAAEAELAAIKQSNLIKDFYPSPRNQGSTIIHLS